MISGLPQNLRRRLGPTPKSGEGVHDWIFMAAKFLRGRYLPERIVAMLKVETSNCGRDVHRERNELSFHSLRHNATSMLKEAGIPESVARELVGHASAAVSRQYTHVGDDALREAVESLPEIYQ